MQYIKQRPIREMDLFILVLRLITVNGIYRFLYCAMQRSNSTIFIYKMLRIINIKTGHNYIALTRRLNRKFLMICV